MKTLEDLLGVGASGVPSPSPGIVGGNPYDPCWEGEHGSIGCPLTPGNTYTPQGGGGKTQVSCPPQGLQPAPMDVSTAPMLGSGLSTSPRPVSMTASVVSGGSGLGGLWRPRGSGGGWVIGGGRKKLAGGSGSVQGGLQGQEGVWQG